MKHPFKNGHAGDGWLANFVRRHPEIALRQSEATSLARARAFNRPSKEAFFNNLDIVIKKDTFSLRMIWNVDETGTKK